MVTLKATVDQSAQMVNRNTLKLNFYIKDFNLDLKIHPNVSYTMIL